MLQELLKQELLEALTIPRGIALVSPLPLLLSVLFPFLFSPLFTPVFTFASKKLLVQDHFTICEGYMVFIAADSLPQELEIFPCHMGLWYGEHQIRWG